MLRLPLNIRHLVTTFIVLPSVAVVGCLPNGQVSSPPPPDSVGRWVPPPPPGPACKDCPNIIFALTDDQDVQLGGWDPMTQTKKLLQDDPNGAFLTNWRIHTPICSPRKGSLTYVQSINNNSIFVQNS